MLPDSLTVRSRVGASRLKSLICVGSGTCPQVPLSQSFSTSSILSGITVSFVSGNVKPTIAATKETIPKSNIGKLLITEDPYNNVQCYLNLNICKCASCKLIMYLDINEIRCSHGSKIQIVQSSRQLPIPSFSWLLDTIPLPRGKLLQRHMQ